MLTLMRNFLRSKVSLVLFGLIIISMAAWGITDVFSGNLGDNIIQAGKRGITQQDFDRRVETYLRVQRNQGQMMTRQDAVEQGIIDQLFALEGGRIANLGYAERIGAVASQKAVVETVGDNEAFADPLTGQFSVDTYRRILNQNQLTPQRFENEVRDDLTLTYLSDAAGAALEPPESLKRLQAGYLAESRDAAWFTVSQTDIGELSEPSEDEVAAFYQGNQARFAIGERRAISRLDLSPTDFIHQVDTSEEDLLAIYESQKRQRFSEPDTRRFVELVLADEAAARDALGRLAGGAEPSTLVAAEAINIRTARRSELANEALADALFSSGAQPGAIAGPFEQNGLWLVARLEDVTPGAAMPFESVRSQIADEVASNQSEALFAQAEVEAFDLIGAGLRLDEIAAELGGTAIDYLPLTQQARSSDGRVIPALARRNELMATAFGLKVGEVSDPLETETGITLVEVQEVLPPRTPPLDEVADQARQALIDERENNQLTAWASDVEKQIAAGATTLEQVAGKIGASVQINEQPVTRAGNNPQLPASVQGQLFAMNEGEMVSIPGPGAGEMTILQLTAVNEPDETEIAILSGVVSDQLTQSLQNDIMDGLLAEFRDSTSLRANQAALAQYKASIMDRQ